MNISIVTHTFKPKILLILSWCDNFKNSLGTQWVEIPHTYIFNQTNNVILVLGLLYKYISHQLDNQFYKYGSLCKKIKTCTVETGLKPV